MKKLTFTYDLPKMTMKLSMLIIFISSTVFVQPTYAANNLGKCLNAVFGSSEKKRLKIYGHHFNCKPIRTNGNSYSGRISHNVKWDFDEQMDYKFKIKADGSLDVASFNVKIKLTKKGKWMKKGIGYLVAKSGYEGEISALVNKAKKGLRGDWKSAGNAVIANIIERSALQQKHAKKVTCKQPTLWKDAAFRGKKLIVKQANRNMHSTKFGDLASSVCVPKGWAIRLYENKNLKGKSLKLQGPAKVINLRHSIVKGKHFDNRISSVNVVRN